MARNSISMDLLAPDKKFLLGSRPMGSCRSVRPSVRPSVRLPVGRPSDLTLCSSHTCNNVRRCAWPVACHVRLDSPCLHGRSSGEELAARHVFQSHARAVG